MVNKLAVEGGAPICTRAHGSWPRHAQDEIDAAMNVLRSGKINYWTGDEGRQFEREFAAFAGCKYAIALANGTVALESALQALNVGPGDEVITTSRTFIASASCAVAVGARPVIADVDRNSQNLTVETVRPLLNAKTKAIVAVHLAGWPCDMDSIMELARRRGIKVIEDCAQAQGAMYKGRPVGSIGDAAAFSFCQDKIMTTGGEGGMLTTNNAEIWDRAWSYKDHGKSYAAVYRCDHEPGFRWLHESFGTNLRMTEMQSAIGRVALRKVSKWIEKRRNYAERLSECLGGMRALRITIAPDAVYHSYYKYYAFVVPERLRAGWDRDRISRAINAEGIPCYVGSCSEIYLEKAFTEHWGTGRRLPIAQQLGETSLMFLVHPTLSEEDVEDTCRAVQKVLHAATQPVGSVHPFAAVESGRTPNARVRAQAEPEAPGRTPTL
jgi:dTDP-4-amino-4,6-dideoxygalactose transaminase